MNKTEGEHLNWKDGDIAGLWDIDIDKAEGDYWGKITQIIEAYVKLHPNEMKMLIYENQVISQTRLRETGADETSSLRWGGAIPPGLFFKLQQYDPMLFEDKKLFHKFLKKFKAFQVCKKI